MDVFTHFSIVRRERRGIRPEEIKLWDEAKIKEFISHRLSQTGVTFTEEEISSLVRQSQGKPREVMQNCFKLYQTKVNNSASRT